jgi:hypothetical protein
MPVQPWNPIFSPSDPGTKTTTFFEGSTKYYIMIERTQSPHRGAAPIVSIGITNKNDTQDVRLAEGDRQYYEGNQCHGVSCGSPLKGVGNLDFGG